MSNYSKEEALKLMEEKYKIAIAIKDWDMAKECFLKIKELRDEQ